ncbi:hypothetical protein BC829DRAFT_391544 [Chytridium lagenaria]|nr:hypothetical protein BC829DRAFT_391544 [Chytridium lagenaria]
MAQTNYWKFYCSRYGLRFAAHGNVEAWQAPPPEHSITQREAAYRFGASLSWKLGSFFGFSCLAVASYGYLTLDDPQHPLTPTAGLAFVSAIVSNLIHSMLLLAISLRLGAYRAPHYQHSHPSIFFSNPVSKIKIHFSTAMVTFGNIFFSGGICLAVITGDGTLAGFWPIIPGGVFSLMLGWIGLAFI